MCTSSLSSRALQIDFSESDRGLPQMGRLKWCHHNLTVADQPALSWEIECDGQRYNPDHPDLQIQPAKNIPENQASGNCLTYLHRSGDWAVCQHIVCEESGLTQWLEVKNLMQDRELKLSEMLFLTFQPGLEFQSGLEVRSGAEAAPRPSSENYFGVQDPVVYLSRPHESWGLTLINLAPGQTRLIQTGLRMALGYSLSPAPFSTHVPPGGQFSSDRGVLSVYEGDPQSHLHQYLQKSLRKDHPLPLDCTYCSWEPFFREINEERLLDQMRHASDLGFETFVIDDGWQNFAGDWQADPLKFPRGLAPLRDYAEKQGMRLGLWFALTTLHHDSKAFALYEDCLVTNAQGEARSTHVVEGKLSMGCLVSRYADHISTRLHDLVSSLNLRYLKLDLPTAFDVYNQPVIQCHACDHDHKPGPEYSLAVYRAVQKICQKLKTEFPDLLIDLTFEVWGGWHMIDPALISQADVCWLSNLNDAPASGEYAPAAARHLAAVKSGCVPPEHLVVGNLRVNGPSPQESVVSAMSFYPVLLGDLAAVTASDRQDVQRLFAFFKSIRDQYALHDFQKFFATADKADFSIHQASGFIRCSEAGEGLFAVFRNLDPQQTFCCGIPLPEAVSDQVGFKIEDHQNLSSKTCTAAELRKGIPFEIEHPHGFQLFAIRPEID